MHGISELLELFQQLFALGYGPGLVNLRVPDVPLRVQDERGALVHAPFFVEHAVGFAGRAVRPVIREEREGNAAQFLGPRLEAGRGVGADIQDLAVQLLEFFVVRTEPVDLVRSPAGKRERHERDHDRLALEARKRDLLVGMRGKREIGRCTTCFRFQGETPSCIAGKADTEEYPRAGLPAIALTIYRSLRNRMANPDSHDAPLAPRGEPRSTRGPGWG